MVLILAFMSAFAVEKLEHLFDTQRTSIHLVSERLNPSQQEEDPFYKPQPALTMAPPESSADELIAYNMGVHSLENPALVLGEVFISFNMKKSTQWGGLCIYFAKEHKGKGYGKETLDALHTYITKKWPDHGFYAHIPCCNLSSIKCFLKSTIPAVGVSAEGELLCASCHISNSTLPFPYNSSVFAKKRSEGKHMAQYFGMSDENTSATSEIVNTVTMNSEKEETSLSTPLFIEEIAQNTLPSIEEVLSKFTRYTESCSPKDKLSPDEWKIITDVLKFEPNAAEVDQNNVVFETIQSYEETNIDELKILTDVLKLDSNAAEVDQNSVVFENTQSYNDSKFDTHLRAMKSLKAESEVHEFYELAIKKGIFFLE